MPLPGVKFSPNIELGHVLQALIVVGSLSGYALWGYATIERQLADEHTEISLLQQRADTDENAAKQERVDQRARDEKIGAALDKISDQLGEIKVQVATSKADGSHR